MPSSQYSASCGSRSALAALEGTRHEVVSLLRLGVAASEPHQGHELGPLAGREPLNLLDHLLAAQISLLLLQRAGRHLVVDGIGAVVGEVGVLLGHEGSHLDDQVTEIVRVDGKLLGLHSSCFAVPANRIGNAVYSPAELTTIQEVITLIVFAGFTAIDEPLSWAQAAGFALIRLGAALVFHGQA
jgi:hypothetical protein